MPIRSNAMHNTKNPPGQVPIRRDQTLGGIIDRVNRSEANPIRQHPAQEGAKTPVGDHKTAGMGITYQLGYRAALRAAIEILQKELDKS